MNTTFNYDRLWLLIKRYFTENKQRELTFWGISIVVFMLMRDSGAVITYLLIAGFFTAANAFRIFSHTPGGMHYLLIPATHSEKLVTNIIINTFYFFLAFLVTYIVGTFLGIHLDNMIFNHHNPVNFNLFNDSFNSLNGANNFLILLYTFAVSQAVAITGSLFFKRSAAMKTLLVIIIVFFVLGIMEVTMLKLMFDTYELSGETLTLKIGADEFNDLFPAMKIIAKIFGLVLLPFLWTVSYFRLTEKEV